MRRRGSAKYGTHIAETSLPSNRAFSNSMFSSAGEQGRRRGGWGGWLPSDKITSGPLSTAPTPAPRLNAPAASELPGLSHATASPPRSCLTENRPWKCLSLSAPQPFHRQPGSLCWHQQPLDAPGLVTAPGTPALGSDPGHPLLSTCRKGGSGAQGKILSFSLFFPPPPLN